MSAVIVTNPLSLLDCYAVSTGTVTAVSWDLSAVNFRVKFLRALRNLNKNRISRVSDIIYSFIYKIQLHISVTCKPSSGCRANFCAFL